MAVDWLWSTHNPNKIIIIIIFLKKKEKKRIKVTDSGTTPADDTFDFIIISFF